MLYMRGVSELDQLDHPDGIPDFLFSNTRSVAERARAKGHEVTFIPSLVDLTGSRTESTREVALLVSPTELQGVEVGLMLAERRPDVRFVFQRSWSLDPIAETELQRRVAELPNVELREVTAGPDAIYRDARLLIAPHRVDNRPRVILEAQANGIPVLTTELPGLIDQMGDGGNSVALDGSDEEWLAAFSDLWDDDDRYESMSERARHWAARDEQDPETIVTRFEAEIDDVVSRAVER